MVSCATSEAVANALQASLPEGVRFDGEQRLVDEVVGREVILSREEVGLLERLLGTGREHCTVPEDERALLLGLNRLHFVNGSPARSERLPLTRRALPPDSSIRSIARIFVSVLELLVGRRPLVTGLFLVALTVILSPTRGLLLGGVVASGLFLHETGHWLVSRALSRPSYLVQGPWGVSIVARLRSATQVRLFAAAGPLLPVVVGLILWLALPERPLRHLVCVPLLCHLVFLVPPSDDGYTLLRGRTGPAPGKGGQRCAT